MPKFLKILIVSACALTLLLIFLVKLVLPFQLKKQITTRIEKNCESCEFSSETIQVKFMPSRIVFKNVHFRAGNAKDTLIEAQVEKIVASFSVRALTNQLLKLKQIEIQSPVVVVTEGDARTPVSPPDESPSEWDLEIDQTLLQDAHFTYKREHIGKVGIIQVSYINGEITEMGSTPERRNQPVTAHVRAKLENSGKFDLTVTPLLFSKSTHVDVILDMKNLNLSEINRYFTPNDGIQLKGVLARGVAKVAVRGPMIQSEVHAKYRGLSLTFKKTFERSRLSATISNLFAGIKSAKDRKRAARINRELQEPLVGFVLRGMKEAAIKVVTD